MQIRPVSDLRNKFPEVEKLVEGGEPVFLTKNGYGSMVVISLEEYERLTRRDNFISDFEGLVGQAKNMLHITPEAVQVIVVRTKKNRIMYFINKMDVSNIEAFNEAEETFIQRLIYENETEIKHLVCMWDSYGVSVPSIYFRERLLEISPKNEDAQIMVQGADDFYMKKLKVTMPPKKELIDADEN